MAYIDVITLSQAKNYLRIDDTLTEDDNAITRMIGAALKYVEKYTGVLVFARDEVYLAQNGELKLYEYPINTDLDTLTDYTYERKGLYTNICTNNTKTIDITLNMGYVDPTEVPQELLEVAYEIIDLYYYGEKDGKPIDKKLSALSMDALNMNKRFWL